MILLGVLLTASYTLAVAITAGMDETRCNLGAARLGAYATVSLIGVAVCLLAYAFITHDFRIRYVARYSDRSMGLAFLLSSLWGGQDGSILWWLFLLSLHIAVCTKWLKNRYLALQPYVLAVLMAVTIFFCILMVFSANPFATSTAGNRIDGEGLNPLLQNLYMIIHPPSLYMGFVGCTIPFAFAIAALITGRLDREWIVAVRPWMLFSWTFLALGNTLGMLWAYEELGWGGYWAWDPVENAALMPLLTASAYLHSAMIQERRGMFKLWNILLVCFTFFLTIFGTFLTRSGAVSSIHSFAQSSIGSYFIAFLALILFATGFLILYRWPELRGFPPVPSMRRAALGAACFFLLFLCPSFYLTWVSPLPFPLKVSTITLIAGAGTYTAVELIFRRLSRQADSLPSPPLRPSIESLASREFAFMLNNWKLVGLMGFILTATTFPIVSETIWKEKITIGPLYYNAWVQPIGLFIFALMGIGSLFGWKHTSSSSLKKSIVPSFTALAAAFCVHWIIGSRIGFPPLVWGDAPYEGWIGKALQTFSAWAPVLTFSLCAFNTVIIIQEFYSLFYAKQKTKSLQKVPPFLWYAGFFPGFFYTLVTLPSTARRRYGGYIVHLGIVAMFFGFMGSSWNIVREVSLSPGETYPFGRYELEYKGPHIEVDETKRMVFADISVKKKGVPQGILQPAKFIFHKMPDSPTTEVAMLHSLHDDLYIVVGMISPQTKQANFQFHLNPLVSWIWIGCFILMVGSTLCMWPDAQWAESRRAAFARGGFILTTSLWIGTLLFSTLMIYQKEKLTSPLNSTQVGTIHEKNLLN
ncbi:heme lyase CcmF/NrfE family subunit [Pajaroellobacter abortibovis]|nr:cytochrome c-type biogenesis CcmF C-terminal domain-containing protein [Pajaroellobacter abortibovis]